MDSNLGKRTELEAFKRERRWDVFGLFLGLALAAALVPLLDTGKLAVWIANHKHTKLDEAICAGVILLVGVTLFSLRRWARLRSRFLRSEGSMRNDILPDANQLKHAHRQDLLGLLIAVGAAVAMVFVFDTGSLADWVAAHKHTKVDEIIVSIITLLIGLIFFSIRRWLELSHQIVRYEELYREMTRLNRQSTLLGEFSDLLQSCVSSEEAHQVIASRAHLLFPGLSGALCVTARSRDVVEVVANWGKPSVPERSFAPEGCWALRRGRLHVYGEDPGSLPCAHAGSNLPAGSICMPMMAHGEALGMLYLDTGQNGEGRDEESSARFSAGDQKLCRTFAEQAALGLANINMREILEVQSTRDPLTGLYNRRYMEESLEREISRASRRNSEFGLMMVDVDHFKRFNDIFGHETGDLILRNVGKILAEQFRGEDVACRYGGEEFTIILPGANLHATLARAEQICELAKKHMARVHGASLGQFSLSVGVSSFPASAATGEGLLRAADSALYRAKEEGRDRVLVA